MSPRFRDLRGATPKQRLDTLMKRAPEAIELCLADDRGVGPLDLVGIRQISV